MTNPSQLVNDEQMIAEQSATSCQLKSADANMESSEDSNDEIQRYMHGRGCSKRHTVGCTDDLSKNPSGQSNTDQQVGHSPIPSPGISGQSGASSSGRTRRTGLLTVMERPPGITLCLLRAFILIFYNFLLHAASFLLKKRLRNFFIDFIF